MKRPDGRRAAAALLACVLTALLSPAPRASAQGGGPPHPYATRAPLDEARIFAEGVVSTPEHEDSPGFSRDGRTVYWEYGLPVRSTLVYSRFERGRWGAPRVVEFSGRHDDRDPFISPDGNRFFFCSKRPVVGRAPARADWDIWVADRTAAGAWGEPRRLPAPVNTEADELYATETADGTLYFGSARAGGRGGWDLYRARREGGGYAAPENLGDAVNTPSWEFNPAVSPDERLLFFSSPRPGGQGQINIYVSVRRDGAWTPARNVGDKVNAKSWQYHPTLSPDGRYLFFCGGGRGLGSRPPARPVTYRELIRRLRGARNHKGNIYQIGLSALGIE